MQRQEEDELTPEQDTEQAAAVSRVNKWCKLAELSASADDEYEVRRFDELLSKAMGELPALSDSFYASAARHCIVSALCRANRHAEASRLAEEIKVEFILEKVLEENPSLSLSREFLNAKSISQLQQSVEESSSEADERFRQILEDVSGIRDQVAELEAELSQRISFKALALNQISNRLSLVTWLLIGAIALLIFLRN